MTSFGVLSDWLGLLLELALFLLGNLVVVLRLIVLVLCHFVVTVIGKIGLLSAAPVLQNFDRCCKVNFALEELLRRDFIQLASRVSIGRNDFVAELNLVKVWSLTHILR